MGFRQDSGPLSSIPSVPWSDYSILVTFVRCLTLKLPANHTAFETTEPLVPMFASAFDPQIT